MTLRHNPHGSGHPYRYDLDQRVPTTPVAGEPFEIRILADDQETGVYVLFDDGTKIPAQPVNDGDLQRDHGPRPSGQTAAGHLAAAAESQTDDQSVQIWRAMAPSAVAGSYGVHSEENTPAGQRTAHPVDPTRWTTGGGNLTITGSDERLDANSVLWLVNDHGAHRVRFRLRLDPGQHISGLGERYGSLDHRGKTLDAVVFEQYKHQGDRTYLPAPMAVVVGGLHWGFHLQTTHRTWFDLGASDARWIEIEADIDPTDPKLDLGIWNGEPNTIVQAFLKRTGQPKLAPDWVFEPWISGNEWNTQARVEREVARSLKENIPVGVIVIEAWSDESTFVAFRDAAYDVHVNGEPHCLEDFTFPDDGAWPDPVGMVERLHDQGIKVLLWQIPLIPTDRGSSGQVQADLDALESLGHCIRNADGSPHTNRGWWFPGALLPDFTSPATRAWWADKRRYLLDQIGIDGFKTDGGEHLWGHDLVFADGTRGAESNNRFPVLFAQTYHELMDKTSTDGVTFSRSGFAGSAAFPGHWAGDEDSTWEAFRSSILAGLSAGIAGLNYWGWDLAGFSGDIPTPELYLRSTAMAAFSPIMQYHSEFNHHAEPNVDRTPWNIADRWGDPSVIDVFRQFVELRESLIPYLAQQVRRSIESGRPLMRPLFFDHPDDETTWAVPLQYQLGDELIVAPITDPGTQAVDVYLPAGTWQDFYTNEQHIGPVWITRQVSIDEIAVYRTADAGPSLLPRRSSGRANSR